MLSMVASVYELRQGMGIPKTIAELCESASDAMLVCGGAVSVELRTLIEAILFEAHAAQARGITMKQVLDQLDISTMNDVPHDQHPAQHVQPPTTSSTSILAKIVAVS